MEIVDILKSKYTVKDQSTKQFVYEDVSVWADWGLDLADNTIDISVTTPSLNVLSSTAIAFNGTDTLDLPANILEAGDYLLSETVSVSKVKVTPLSPDGGNAVFTVKGDWTDKIQAPITGDTYCTWSDGTSSFDFSIADTTTYDSVTDLTTISSEDDITTIGFTPTQIVFTVPFTYVSTYTYAYAQFTSVSEIFNFTPNCDANTLTVVDDSTYIATISEGVTNTPTAIVHVSHIAYYPPAISGISSMYNGGANKTIVIPTATDGAYTIIKQSTVTYTILDNTSYNIVLVMDIMLNRPYTLACTDVMDSLCVCFYNLVKQWEDAMVSNPRYADQYMKKIILVMAYDHLYHSAMDRGCTSYESLFASTLVQLLGGCGCSGATTNIPTVPVTPCNQ
jgi:hypothetical protein